MKALVFQIILLFFIIFQTYSQQLKMDHLALVVSDLNESAEFYGTTLGLQEIEDKTQKDNIRWFGFGNGLELHLIHLEDQDIRIVKSVHLAIAVDDLPGFITKLKKASVYFENWSGESNTSGKRSDGVDQVYLQDPDGYWIEVNNAARF